MSVVVVVIGTTHESNDDAVRSVSAGLKRAGYDVLDYVVHEVADLRVIPAQAMIEACEPEVNPRGDFHY